jgi:hypothetical protein
MPTVDQILDKVEKRSAKGRSVDDILNTVEARSAKQAKSADTKWLNALGVDISRPKPNDTSVAGMSVQSESNDKAVIKKALSGKVKGKIPIQKMPPDISKEKIRRLLMERSPEEVYEGVQEFERAEAAKGVGQAVMKAVNYPGEKIGERLLRPDNPIGLPVAALKAMNPEAGANAEGGVRTAAGFLPYLTPAAPALVAGQGIGIATDPSMAGEMVKGIVQRPIDIARDIKGGKVPQSADIIALLGDLGMAVGGGLHVAKAVKGRSLGPAYKGAPTDLGATGAEAAGNVGGVGKRPITADYVGQALKAKGQTWRTMNDLLEQAGQPRLDMNNPMHLEMMLDVTQNFNPLMAVPAPEAPALPAPKKALPAPRTVAPPVKGTLLDDAQVAGAFRDAAQSSGGTVSADGATATIGKRTVRRADWAREQGYTPIFNEELGRTVNGIKAELDAIEAQSRTGHVEAERVNQLYRKLNEARAAAEKNQGIIDKTAEGMGEGPTTIEAMSDAWDKHYKNLSRLDDVEAAVKNSDAAASIVAESEAASNARVLADAGIEANRDLLRGFTLPEPTHIPWRRPGSKFKLKGYDVDSIVENTGLSRERISELIRENATGKQGEYVYESLGASGKRMFGELTASTITIHEANALKRGMGGELKTPRQFGSRNRIINDQQVAASLDYIDKAGKRLNSLGLDPAAMYHAGRIGLYYLEGGVREFGAWSAEMVTRMGEGIRPHLETIWGDLSERHPNMKLTPIRARVVGSPGVAPGIIADITNSNRVTETMGVGEVPPKGPSSTRAGSGTAPGGEDARVGSINFAQMEDAAQLRDFMKERYAANEPQITEQRRGVRTWEETEAAAKDMGMSAKEYGRIKSGTVANAEQMHAAVQDVQKYGNRVKIAEETYKNADTSDNLASLLMARAEFDTVFGAVQGLSREMGRGLNILKKAKAAFEPGNPTYQEKALFSLKEMYGGDKAVDLWAKRIREIDPNNYTELYSTLIKASRIPWTKKLNTYRVANMLWSTTAHARNIVGNSVNTVLEQTLHPAYAGVDAVLAPLQGRERYFYLKQWMPSNMALLEGVPNGFRKAGYVLKHGFEEATAQKWDMPYARELPDIRIKGREITNPINYSLRGLSAEDAVARTAVESMELSKRAMATAINETSKAAKANPGIDPKEAVSARYKELMDNPTQEMLDAAEKMGDFILLTSDLGEAATHMVKMLDKSIVGDWIIPFKKVPINDIKRGLELTPIGIGKLANPEVRKGPEAVRTVVRSMVAGTALVGLGAALYKRGVIATSAPENPAERDAWYADGRKENTIRVAGRWLPLSNLGPMSIPVTAGATFASEYDAKG